MTVGVCPVCGKALESVACTGLRCGHPWLDSVRVHANGETCASQSPPPRNCVGYGVSVWLHYRDAPDDG